MLNIGVFGSGRGSNFQAIVDALGRGTLPDTRITVVVSNNSDAGILSIARANSLPAIHLSMKQFMTEEEFVRAQLATLQAHTVNCIVLAGYMKKLHPRLIAAYRHRIVNIHPALLPAFGGRGMFGMHVHQAVISSGSPMTGATVHLVDEEYDHGSILLQKSIPVDRGETPESLAAKVLQLEHELYPEALRLIAEGKILLGTASRNTVSHS